MASPRKSLAPIVVIGAGIIGLTTAVRLLQSQVGSTRQVHIIAAHDYQDPLDAEYASTAAGAHHVSFAEDGEKGKRQREWDLRTLSVFQQEYERHGESTGLMAIMENFTGSEKHLNIMESYPNFKLLAPPPGVNHAASYSTYTMTPHLYLSYLVDLFKQLSNTSEPRLHKAHVNSLTSSQIQDIIHSTEPPSAIILCAGLHSPSLCPEGEPKDQVYPIRGQVVKLRAPWVTEGSTRQVGALGGPRAGLRTYLIPNLGGVLVAGGTRGEHDWEKKVRPETTVDILKRALEAFPWLAPPPQIKPPFPGATVLEHLQSLIINQVVGFRPARDAGVRLERGPDIGPTKLIYNYGHGGAGWQSSWATAEDAVKLVQDALKV